MATRRQGIGAAGEAAAAEYLRARGCRILASNYHARDGEVDLIAEQGECLLFVEVKARTGLDRGGGADAVGRLKQRRLTRAAFHYLAEHAEERPCRFHVVEVFFHEGSTEVRLIADAFEPNERDLEW